MMILEKIMNDYWNGKVVIITGATHGIGLRLAERLSKKGVKISTIYRNNDDRANNLKKIIDNNGSELYIIKGDIIDKNNIKTLIEGTIFIFLLWYSILRKNQHKIIC